MDKFLPGDRVKVIKHYSATEYTVLNNKIGVIEKRVLGTDRWRIRFEISDWKIGGLYGLHSFKEEHLILIERPFKNHIKQVLMEDNL